MYTHVRTRICACVYVRIRIHMLTSTSRSGSRSEAAALALAVFFVHVSFQLSCIYIGAARVPTDEEKGGQCPPSLHVLIVVWICYKVSIQLIVCN